MSELSNAFAAIKDNVSEVQRYYRDGIELEKGASITPERIKKNQKLYRYYCWYFSTYPDLFIDLITPRKSAFKLYYYQRIFLRACARYKYHYCTAPRAFSKTFISILSIVLKCIFLPHSKCFITAPKKEQSAKIAVEKLDEIFKLFPLLKQEVVSYLSGKDYVKVTFKNGSIFDVVGALESARGGRRHFGLIDEVRKVYENLILTYSLLYI